MSPTDDPPPPGSLDETTCLYRRTAGRAWWRVDASVTPQRDILIVSGDASEWHAIVRGAAKDALLRALRRDADLVAGIGATREQEILARLHQRFYRGPDHTTGPFEEIKAFLTESGVPWEASFWAGDTEGEGAETPRLKELSAVLSAARALLALPRNDFTWSFWADAGEATGEIDALAAQLEAGQMPDRAALDLLFSPAGPMQEVSLSSGWGRAFVDLAAAYDEAIGAGS